MSLHTAPVVRLPPIDDHPNADALGVVHFDGYTAVVKLGEFQHGELVVYIEPDTMVDTTRREFAFLARPGRSLERITVKRLRGVYSMGLVVRAPIGMREGEEAWDALGLERYEPKTHMTLGGNAAPAPSGGYRPTYDVENFRRFGYKVLEYGEQVVVTEKIHGTNARFTYADGALQCGSHRQWKDASDGSVWARIATQEPTLEEFLKNNPWFTIYGEIYGDVQSLRYGCAKGEIKFAVFDIWNHETCQYMDYDTARFTIENFTALKWVPEVYYGMYSDNMVDDFLEMAEGPSVIPGAGHMREGVVIRPVTERKDRHGNRVQYKIVSNEFLVKGK